MFELKLLSPTAIPAALAQAERYRLLNEPGEAESICLDVLRVAPEHQEATVTLVLALTDQFPEGPVFRAMAAAEAAVAGLRDEYKRLYYLGIIRERRGKAELRSNRPGSNRVVHDWLDEAMSCYEKAEAIRPAGNDEAILRWNTCARILMDLPKVEPDIPAFHAVQSE
jgi:tetratricopeptide (TPR) repeat protein